MSGPGSSRPDGAGRSNHPPPPRGAARPRLEREFFDDLYTRSADPWDFAGSLYERDKYAHTLAALGDARFGRALEVGCSIAVFTERLATVCDDLVGIDVSPLAVERARRRLRGLHGVKLAAMTFPEEMPDGPWDLVVCSEVLYYLDDGGFALAVDRLRAALEGGGHLLAVHWRPPTSRYPLGGDEVHDRLVGELGRWHRLDERRPRYRLDLFGAA